MIFDTKIKAEAQASAQQLKLTYLLYYEKKTKWLHVATIEDFLTTLGICRDSFSVIVFVIIVYHRA